MTRVVDKNGSPIEGLIRGSNHGLSVHNPVAHAKYMKEKERIEDLERLKTDVAELKGILSNILEAINGISNTKTSNTSTTGIDNS